MEDFKSKASLLDWDIVLFRPSIREFTYGQLDTYQGRTSLDDTSSFALKESCEHWRREIKQALEAGKTIIVFLPEIEEVFAATGERTFSGTGRNRSTTRIVTLQTNYSALPISYNFVSANGNAIKLAAKGADVLAPFWAEFGPVSQYKVLLPNDTKGKALVTKHGDRTVGVILRNTSSSGSLVLLPDIDFMPDEFLEEKDEEEYWTSEARQFAGKMVSAVVSLDSALRASNEITPEPTWAASAKFVVGNEASLRSDLLECERLVEEAQARKEAVLQQLKITGALRGLLFEKGKPLENVILQALERIGFSAKPYKDGDSEFDVVFECSEGRLIGEAEGKDSKAVNVDKLRQLAMNIHEDLQRDEVISPAKAVLFGNGFRLTPPEERGPHFTEKCITAAESSLTALVATPDLFVAAQYLSGHADDQYAKRCREAILLGKGVVQLPAPPTETPSSDHAPLIAAGVPNSA